MFKQKDAAVSLREVCFQGFYRLERLTLRHALFQGGMGKTLKRELFVRPDAACVLPYDPIQDAVVLIEQFRVGALDKSANPWLLEIVAGLIDAGETPESTVHREGAEEAGLVFHALHKISQYYPSPGGSDEQIHLYLGLCDSQGLDGKICGLASEGEDIKVHVLLFSDAMAKLYAGEICNAAAIIALQWLALNKTRLLKELA